MKVICIEDDHPALKSILKECRKDPEVEEVSELHSAREAIDWYYAHNASLAVMEVDEDAPKVEVRTFGGFDVFCRGELVSFKRARAKEIMAYLVDRQGSSASRAEIFAALYEDEEYDRSMQKQLDVMIRSLRDTLKEYRMEYIFEMNSGGLRIIPERMSCDLYDFLAEDKKATASYRGEYMSSYSWAMMTEAYLDESMILRR